MYNVYLRDRGFCPIMNEDPEWLYDESDNMDSDEIPDYIEDSWKEETTSVTNGDYGPGNPWDAPGMSISDFI